MILEVDLLNCVMLHELCTVARVCKFCILESVTMPHKPVQRGSNGCLRNVVVVFFTQRQSW